MTWLTVPTQLVTSEAECMYYYAFETWIHAVVAVGQYGVQLSSMPFEDRILRIQSPFFRVPVARVPGASDSLGQAQDESSGTVRQPSLMSQHSNDRAKYHALKRRLEQEETTSKKLHRTLRNTIIEFQGRDVDRLHKLHRKTLEADFNKRSADRCQRKWKLLLKEHEELAKDHERLANENADMQQRLTDISKRHGGDGTAQSPPTNEEQFEHRGTEVMTREELSSRILTDLQNDGENYAKTLLQTRMRLLEVEEDCEALRNREYI